MKKGEIPIFKILFGLLVMVIVAASTISTLRNSDSGADNILSCGGGGIGAIAGEDSSGCFVDDTCTKALAQGRSCSEAFSLIEEDGEFFCTPNDMSGWTVFGPQGCPQGTVCCLKR